MKRTAVPTVLLLFVLLPFAAIAQKVDGPLTAIAYWQNVVMKPIKASPNFCVHVRYRPLDDESKEFTYTIGRTPKTKVYFYEGTSCQFNKQGVIIVDNDNRDIIIWKRKGAFYSDACSNYIYRRCDRFRPFIYPNEGFLVSSMYDTVLNGNPYKVLTYKSTHTHVYNDSTQKYDIPSYHIISYYFNIRTNTVEYICAQPMAVERNRAWKEEFWLDYDFSDKQSEYNDIFNSESERYQGYSHHDDDNPPFSYTVNHIETTGISDTLLQYPLISMEGDTTSLSEFEGWLLLDFWSFGCKSCYQWLQLLDKERNSPEGSILDAEGIQILSINPLSDNGPKIRELAKRFNAESFIYHAKGIGNLLDMRYMPRYYLLSPDKEIVYQSGNLGDYKKLIEAKRNYKGNTK